LPRRQRTILYRGICSATEAQERLPRIASQEQVAQADLILDGYNVLLIIYHYLVGYPVFLCRDGLVRDAGLSHGRSAQKERLADVARRLFAVLLGPRGPGPPARLTVILDEAVSHSREHAGIIREAGTAALRGRGEISPEPGIGVVLSRRADAALADATVTDAGFPGYLATSDSQVIDRSPLPIADLPRWVLEESFGVDVEKLRVMDR
jgi:hypothetical protein